MYDIAYVQDFIFISKSVSWVVGTQKFWLSFATEHKPTDPYTLN